MSWMYNATANRLYFVVRVRTTGWVGFGLASQAPTNMTDYDVAVGGVYNGTGYLKVTQILRKRTNETCFDRTMITVSCNKSYSRF